MCNKEGPIESVRTSDTMSEEKFKQPAPPSGPSIQKQRRTMEWLQLDVEDVHHIETVSRYSGRRRNISESDEVDFKELHKRSQSTSTPFIPRTSALTSSFNSDSGIDTFCLSLPSSTTTNSPSDSLFSQSIDIGSSRRFSLDSDHHKFLSSKCSDTDSAFGDASLASHDISQDSQTSECFSLELPSDLSGVPSKDSLQEYENASKPSHKLWYNLGKRNHQESTQYDSVLSASAQSTTPPSFVDSADLSLPAPSWCSPVPTPSTTINKPSCTSTPKDAIQENLRAMLKHFSPGEPDRLIGRKMGLDEVDIVSELHSRSICSLRLVFQHLKPKDLCRACMVSRQWRSAVHSDPASMKRKKLFIRNKKLPCQKENVIAKSCKPSMTERGMTTGLVRLGSIQAMAEKPLALSKEPVTPVHKHQQFWEEAQKCKEGESIRKCPQCSSPARVHNVQERARCSNDRCNFDFCIKCNLPFHGAKDCTFSSPTKKKVKSENIIGSKKSKRKLRRL